MPRQQQTDSMPLSKWWRTESAQRAFERAIAKRNERIQKVREHFAMKQAQLKAEVENWKVVE